MTWSCVVSSSGTASRSFDPAAAAAAIRSTLGTIPRAALEHAVEQVHDDGHDDEEQHASPIQ